MRGPLERRPAASSACSWSRRCRSLILIFPGVSLAGSMIGLAVILGIWFRRRTELLRPVRGCQIPRGTVCTVVSLHEHVAFAVFSDSPFKIKLQRRIWPQNGYIKAIEIHPDAAIADHNLYLTLPSSLVRNHELASLRIFAFKERTHLNSAAGSIKGVRAERFFSNDERSAIYCTSLDNDILIHLGSINCTLIL